MLRKPAFVAKAVSCLVFLYAISPHIGLPDDVVIFLFVLLPFLIVWMAYVILKYGKKPERDLQDGEEWGYQDRERSSLGSL